MNCFMILPLLLMGSSVIAGHSITKLEINNKTEADVYQIREDAATNTIAFINPKADKPTLREIVYYHMIERPYVTGEGRERYESEEGPDFDESMRPFTNSHGFPFLEAVEKELDKKADSEIKEESNEESKDTVPENSEAPPGDEEYEIVYEVYYDDEVPDQPAADDKSPAENIKATPTTLEPETLEVEDTAVEEIKPEMNTAQTSKPKIAIAENKSEIETESGLTDYALPIATDLPVPEPTEDPVFEEKARAARKLLFDRVKERYYSKPNATQNPTATSERRKREIRMHIPEAPKLGKLNYESFPPYLRKLISTTEKPKTITNTNSDLEDLAELEDIERKIDRLLSELDSVDSSEDDEPKPRTYGMNLTDDSGYMWNNVTGHAVHEETSEAEEIKKPRTSVDPESDEQEHQEDIEKFKQRIGRLLSKIKSGDSQVEEQPKPRTYGMNLTAYGGFVWDELTRPGIHYTIEASESMEEKFKEVINEVEGENEKPKEHKSKETRGEEHENNINHGNEAVTTARIENKPEEIHKDEHKSNEQHEDKQVAKAPTDNDENSFEDKGRRRKHKNDDEDTFHKLMESEQFWNWLTDWTSVYIDVLTDHMTEAVEAEIKKQMKVEAQKQNKDSEVHEEHKDISEEPINDKPTSEDKSTEKDKDITTPKPEEADKVDKPAIDNKDVSDIDNKEESHIDKNEDQSTIDNEDDLLKRRKDDKKNKDDSPIHPGLVQNDTRKDTKPGKETTKVLAQNVYGNVVGGEKVTNIYIFYPNQDVNKIIEDISKDTSNYNNVEIRLNVTDVKKDDSTIDKSTQTPVEKNKDSTEVIAENKPNTEATTSESVPTTTSTPTTTTKPNQEAINNEPSVESIKIESTTPVTKQEDSKQKKDEPSTDSSKVESSTASINDKDVITDKQDKLNEDKDKIEAKQETGKDKLSNESNKEENATALPKDESSKNDQKDNPKDKDSSLDKDSNQETTKDEFSTESSKIENDTAIPKNEDLTSDQKDHPKEDKENSPDKDEENEVHDDKEKHETKDNTNATEKSELKDKNKQELISSKPELSSDENKTEKVAESP